MPVAAKPPNAAAAVRASRVLVAVFIGFAWLERKSIQFRSRSCNLR
jgi:hypothetical protein